MSLFYKLSIDQVKPDYISGWCFHRLNGSRPVELQLFRKECLLGEMTADIVREDLAELAIHPTGRCGFELVINDLPQQTGTIGDWVLREKKSQSILAVIDGEKLTVVQPKRPFDFFKKRLSGTQRNDSNLLFMHIPKTAGTSFNTLVRSLLPKEQVISHIEAVGEVNYPQLSKQYRFISGHLRYGVFRDHFIHDKADIYTIIREPYSHLHSHLKWMAVTAADTPDNSPKFRNQTIYRIARRVGETDFSTRSSLQKFVHDIKVIGGPFFDNMQTRHFLDDYVESVTTDHLKRAISTSDTFKLIGFTEEYPQFVRRFSDINGFRNPHTTSTLKRSSTTPLFDSHDPSIREILFPLVCHDLKLHDHIRRNSGY